MVLIRIACVAAVMAACVTARPPVRAQHPTRVAVAILLDHDDRPAVDVGSEALARKVAETLESRNILIAPVAQSMYASFVDRRSTNARLQYLSDESPDAAAVLLVETRAEFYSQIDMKYRWTVSVKATFARRGDLASAVGQSGSYGVFLDFDHEREEEALTAAAPLVDAQLARIADDFIGEMLQPRAGK